MTITVGAHIPSATLKQMTKDGPANLTTDELFRGKTVVLFSVPGAFTPTCHAKHLPGFVQHVADLKAKGVDTIACLAVNDVFVMAAWGKASGVGEEILMLADGNAEFTKALGLELDAIAVVVIGGTLLAGGRGHVLGTLLGLLIFGTIQAAILFDGRLSSWWMRIVVGGLLLGFILLQRCFVRRAGRRG